MKVRLFLLFHPSPFLLSSTDNALSYSHLSASSFACSSARFVNDYRGTGAPRANALFELRSWDIPGSNPARKGIRMAIWAGPHGVEKGAELLVSYGGGFWAERRKEWEAEATAASAAAEKNAASSSTAPTKAGKAVKGKKGKKG
jgi:hypothetical protein